MDAEAFATIGENSQPEIEDAVGAGAVPDNAVDRRPDATRINSWLREAEALGALRMLR